MPQHDGTGPTGAGPMTGRGFGPCGGGIGCGRGHWGGCGYGLRRFFSPKNELAALEDEAKVLEEELNAVREAIVSLKDQQK